VGIELSGIAAFALEAEPEIYTRSRPGITWVAITFTSATKNEAIDTATTIAIPEWLGTCANLENLPGLKLRETTCSYSAQFPCDWRHTMSRK
jgi:hypothetical protein